MPDLAQPVPLSFVFETIAAIFVVIGIGIAAVLRAKKLKDNR